MLTDQQQQRVWEGLFYGQVRAAYFGELANRFSVRQQQVSAATLFLSSGAVVGYALRDASPYMPHAATIISLVTAVLSAYNFTSQLTKRSVEAADLHLKWGQLRNDWQELWDDMHSEDAPAKLAALERKATEYGKPSLSLPWEPRLMEKWENHIRELHYQPAMS